ncbi:hypothetical protein C8J56DRAFT_1038252 [Mycena floridula]|nr:hypothetical protein C8J56DRAFT_1038252 [Mycena floridula]
MSVSTASKPLNSIEESPSKLNEIGLPPSCPTVVPPMPLSSPPTDAECCDTLRFYNEVRYAHETKISGVGYDQLYSAAIYTNAVLNATPGRDEGSPADTPTWVIVLQLGLNNVRTHLKAITQIAQRMIDQELLVSK